MLPSHTRHRLALVTGLVVCLVGVLSPARSVAAPVEERLREARQQVREVREQLRAAQARRSEDAAALEKADARVAEVLEAVAAAEQAVEQQQARVADAQELLQTLQGQADLRDRVAADRLVEIYKQGAGAGLNALLTAGSATEAIQRSTLVELVARSDREALESLDASHDAVDAQRHQLEREKAALKQALEEQELLLAETEELRDERAAVLADTETRIEDLEDQERHAQAEADELARMAREAAERERREAERAAQAARASRSNSGGSSSTSSGSSTAAAAPPSGGGWVWPAAGPVTSRYGPRWGRMHAGIDIGAGTGSAIVAARGGTVSYAGRMSGYGNIVLVNHGNGILTAYAHQSRIMVSTGQSVSAGQRIGSVGCTGSCTGPHLHFEVRVGGAARNPLGYLP